MKKYFWLLLPFIFSCRSNHDDDISGVHFKFRYDYDYTIDIIIGTDTQLVDSIYNSMFSYYLRWGRTHGDSISCSAHVRKYYISKDMNKILMSYIRKHRDNEINCDSVWAKFPIPEFYYNMTAIDKSGKKKQFCMTGRQNALVYFIGLENALNHTQNKNPEYTQMLNDLGHFFNASPFFNTLKEQTWLLNNATPDQRKELINNWHSGKETYEKELKAVRDSLNQIKR